MMDILSHEQILNNIEELNTNVYKSVLNEDIGINAKGYEGLIRHKYRAGA